MNKDALDYPHMASQNPNWVLAGYIAATHKGINSSNIIGTMASYVGDGNFHAVAMLDPDSMLNPGKIFTPTNNLKGPLQ